MFSRTRRPSNPLFGLYFSPETRQALAGRTMILGFGAQKAGSSWLFNRLARSPEICAAPIKEWHFFDCWLRPDLTPDVARIMRAQEQTARLRRPDGRRAEAHAARLAALKRPEAYLDHFAAKIRGRKAMLDISPEYALLDGADLGVVTAYFAAAGVRVRPVFIMRDPVDRLFSYARALAKARRADPVRTFEKALKDPLAMARSRYETTLGALWATFPKEDVTVAFYEDLAGNEAALAALAGRLDLAPPPAAPARRVNPSPAATLPARSASAARARLGETYAFVAKEFGAAVPAGWRRDG
ncbi:sulfotransferase [Pikeienuella sp. HZG-20]|uniref:sulfotransferase n=1 Tax=Paludibacillus litoralis TaxID=3133267 RepID=UPI0030EDAE14